MGHLPRLREKERGQFISAPGRASYLARGDSRWARARDVGGREADVVTRSLRRRTRTGCRPGVR